MRRLQDLVDAQQHQVLNLMFLDWSKAFERITASALLHALTRLGVPAHTCGVIRKLVSNPVLEVIMGEHTSECRQQRSGIRQGCTLSRLLFILLQTVLFHDVQLEHKHRHPLATTPYLPLFDVEFADDTVLIARTREQMQDLLLAVQQETAKCNSHLNLDKTKLILYNSDASVAFRNGDPGPQVASIVYLGRLIHFFRGPGPEVRRRIGEARLTRVWIRSTGHAWYPSSFTTFQRCGSQRRKRDRLTLCIIVVCVLLPTFRPRGVPCRWEWQGRLTNR